LVFITVVESVYSAIRADAYVNQVMLVMFYLLKVKGILLLLPGSPHTAPTERDAPFTGCSFTVKVPGT
jgi:hypothetical protein